MATNMAAGFRCLRQVSQLCRPIVPDRTRYFLRKRCAIHYMSYSFRFLGTKRCGFPVLPISLGKDRTASVCTREKTYRFSTSTTADNPPDLTFESLSELIKDKLQESLDQSSLENHLKLLEALFKHWKGEVLSVAVTRIAQNLPAKEVYKLAALIFETKPSVGKAAVELSAPLFRFSAMAGDTDGMYSYGKLLETGDGGVDADPIEAGRMFSELAEQGHPFAQFALAQLYHNGIGMKKDLNVALSLYEMDNVSLVYKLMGSKERDVQVSAQNGISEANTVIGNMYTTGEAGKVDLTKAAEYFTKAADKGDISALMSLGAFYSQGTGVEKDYEKSFKCYKAAADQGYLTAQYNIGVNYFSGLGVEHDLKKAAYYFDLAAQRGHVPAQINLGNMYYWAYGVEKDWEKSRELYREAAKTNKNAQLLLQELEDEMKGQDNTDDAY